MTTLTIDIDKAEDLAAVKEFLTKRDLFYEEDQNSYEDFTLTDEIKRELDEDEEAYQRGELKLITPEESRAEINKILAGKG